MHQARNRLRGTPAPAPRRERTVDYGEWIRERLQKRRHLYPIAADRPSIDVLTLVFDTPADVLLATARCVFAQKYRPFRWVIWDNGSRRLDTRQVLRRLAQAPCVVLQSSAENLGIARGHAAALRHCQADYVGLLDHDDQLYPDALRIAAAAILQHGQPVLLYSDEDKLDSMGRATCPFFKPTWSPALLQSTGYTCHFTLFHRELAASLGFFEDARVEGAQDWDLALRCFDAGYQGIHIPEVLYSWRMHRGSTASCGAEAKPYVLAAQRRCLEQSLHRRGLSERFTVVSDPLYPFVDGHWHLELVTPEVIDTTRYLVTVPAGLHCMSPNWRQHAIAQLELDPGAGLVGGRVLDDQSRVLGGCPVLGMGALVGTARCGSAATEIGYFGLSLSPRNVAALAEGPWVARTEALAGLGPDAHHLPLPELCLRLHTAGWRIVWTPHVTAWAAARTQRDKHRQTIACVTEFAKLIENDPFYSQYLSLDASQAYQLCRPEARQQALEQIRKSAIGDRT